MSNKFLESLGQFEAFRAYWMHLKDEVGGVPPRSALDPNKIRDLLPFVSLIERRPPDELHVRLAGTAIDGFSPTPLTGRNFLDYCPPEDKQRYWDAVTAIVQTPCGLSLKRDVTFRDGNTHELCSLTLPMKDALGELRYLLTMTAMRRDATGNLPPDGEYVAIRHNHSEFIDLGYGTPEL